MSKCLGHDISVRQHSKSEHWAPCHIQTPSRYDWKIVESDVKPKSNKHMSLSLFHHVYWNYHIVSLSGCIGNFLAHLCSAQDEFITKTCLFKYTETFTTTNWKFSDKKFWYFSYFCSKHRLWVLVRTRARENRKNSWSGPKLRILDRFQTPQNANKLVQHVCALNPIFPQPTNFHESMMS